MKRIAAIVFFAFVIIRGAAGAVNPVDELFKQAQTAYGSARYDDALGVCERIITEHPEAADRWYAAQKSIAQTLAKKGDLQAALQAARVCMDAAPNVQSFDEAVALTANILSAIDGNVDRANRFLSFEETGPGGGAANPMETISYPAFPEREKALAAIREQAGDNATASRIRAYTFLLTGKPREALAQFADAFRRSSNAQEIQRSAVDLVTVGLRAARGHRVDLETAMQFVKYGPNGPDGNPKTADDPADPFASLIAEAPPAGQGGLAGLSADDIAALGKIRDAGLLYAADPFLRADLRRFALASVQRANDALDGWSAEKEEWYLDIIRESNDNLNEFPALGAEAAARGRSLHLGGTRAMWAEINNEVTAKGLKLSRGTINARNQFDQLCSTLDKVKLLKPAIKPLKNPASFK